MYSCEYHTASGLHASNRIPIVLTGPWDPDYSRTTIWITVSGRHNLGDTVSCPNSTIIYMNSLLSHTVQKNRGEIIQALSCFFVQYVTKSWRGAWNHRYYRLTYLCWNKAIHKFIRVSECTINEHDVIGKACGYNYSHRRMGVRVVRMENTST